MTVATIKNGQEDWTNALNADLSQIGDFTSWSTAGIAAMNGFSIKNICWRRCTKKDGDRTFTILEIAGWIDNMPSLAPNQHLQIMKLAAEALDPNQHLQIMKLAAEVYKPIGNYFAQASSIGGSAASGLEFDPQTGIITATNGYNFKIENFGSFISLLIIS